MQLELFPAVVVSTGVVQGDSSLPQLRREGGSQLHDLVESRGRFGDAACYEIGNSAIENVPRLLRREHECGGYGYDNGREREARRRGTIWAISEAEVTLKAL